MSERPWAVAETERLCLLWQQTPTQSTGAIGILLGRSKCSTLSKVRRLIAQGRLLARAEPPSVHQERRIPMSPAQRQPRVRVTLPSMEPPPDDDAPASAVHFGRSGVGHISVLVSAAPVRSCCYPLWSARERPSHRYCEAPLFRRGLCQEHYSLCYTQRIAS